MNAKEKWEQMVTDNRQAVEDFQDDLETKAIVWAADRIEELEKQIANKT